MRRVETSSRLAFYGWSLLILLLAAFLRFHDLLQIPPGLTHDEADHGLTAWNIINQGLRDIYFSIGYGREPLYDYVVALHMSVLGPTILAGRLVSAFAGLLMIAGLIAWVKRAFGQHSALLAGAGLAIAFWPVMSARQALRSVLLPLLFVLAVLIFWLAIENVLANRSASGSRSRPFWRVFQALLPFATSGVLLGLTFYTYIPARALWIIFPALVIYWLLTNRKLAALLWWRIGFQLLVALLVASPLLLHLWANPEIEKRIGQLAEPLYAAQRGQWEALAGNALQSLRLFFIEGDPTWRYNIADRPFLDPLWGLLFVVGVVLASWWMITRRETDNELLGSAAFLSLSWLVVGFLPVLVTGPALSMTQAIAIQPLLYLFPAIVLATLWVWINHRLDQVPKWAFAAGLLLLYAALAVVTWRDYFQTWANHPEVRVQYESTMVAALAYVNDHAAGEVAISTITPDRLHSPALAQMMLQKDNVSLRWFDGRGSLLLPRDETALTIVPGFTPLPPALFPYWQSAQLVDTLPLRQTDLDRPLDFYQIDRSAMRDRWRDELQPIEAQFGSTVELLGFDLESTEVKPGAEINLVTHWRARQSLDEAVLFVHLIGDTTGPPLAQADRLDVPGYSWQPGDEFLQLHQFTLPPDLDPGAYELAVGVYDGSDALRLPLQSGGDLLPIAWITVVQ